MIAPTLRKSILQAAISGRLTEQRAEDGDARDLLAAIRKEKTRLVREGKLKKEKALPAITKDEVPFEIPENWCWARLGMIGEIIGGGTPRTSEPKNWTPATIPWLTPADMANVQGRYVTHGARNISEEGLARSSARLMPAGTVLFSSRAPIGYVGIAKNALATNQGFKSIVPICTEISEYLYFCLIARTNYIQSIATGTTFLEVSGTTMKSVPIPIAPLMEQHRIVETINQILPELTKLEADEQQLDALETSFPSRMKASILQAAISGQLTEREAGDGDARELLAEIDREKGRLIKEKKIKREKALPPVDEDEAPFEIPENWCWVRLGTIGEIVGGGTPKTSEPKNWTPATVPWLTPADMANIQGKEVTHGARNISEEGLAHSSARLMPAGTVLFSSRAPIGYVGIAKNALATNQGFKSIVPFHAGMSEYLYFCLMARTKYIQSIATGTTFLEVSGTTMKSVPIPLPPLAEQRRIVERVEEVLEGLE